MKLATHPLISLGVNLVLVCICTMSGAPEAKADLNWPQIKKVSMRVRLVALAESDPRSSFFSTQEVFVASQQLTENETRLVKLVYTFLPYQPRLSDIGLDYYVVHEIRTVRDPGCDETLAAMITDQRDRRKYALKYSTNAPELSVERRHSELPCYATDPEDYSRGVHQPAGPDSE